MGNQRYPLLLVFQRIVMSELQSAWDQLHGKAPSKDNADAGSSIEMHELQCITTGIENRCTEISSATTGTSSGSSVKGNGTNTTKYFDSFVDDTYVDDFGDGCVEMDDLSPVGVMAPVKKAGR